MGNAEITTQNPFPKTLGQKSKEEQIAFDHYSKLPDYITERDRIELEKAAKTAQILSDSKTARDDLRKDIQAENEDEEDSQDEEKQTKVSELSEREFFDRMLEISMNTYKKYWAPHPRVILWQALFETWFGKSWVAKNKNNLFWFRLKNKERWVFEYIRYTSMEEATEAYADKMVNSQYYSKTLKHKDDPKKYITALIKAWYCSTPPSKYIAGIESCLNKYWLSLDDKIDAA